MQLAEALFLSCSLFVCACGSDGSPGGGTGGTASGGAAGSGGTSGAAGAANGGASGAADAAVNPVVEMQTSMGKMVFELDAARMPITTQNFLEYVDAGFYSGTLFHRVIPDFMIQGGGFTSGLTQKTPNAPIVLETSPDIVHDYGVISMARTTNPDSATCQFFVVNAKDGYHSLDGKYAAFGHLLEGNAVLDAISAVPTQTVGTFENVPVTDVVITSATRK